MTDCAVQNTFSFTNETISNSDFHPEDGDSFSSETLMYTPQLRHRVTTQKNIATERPENTHQTLNMKALSFSETSGS
jgi:hypothetical protein